VSFPTMETAPGVFVQDSQVIITWFAARED
jgi:hypothetical protein